MKEKMIKNFAEGMSEVCYYAPIIIGFGVIVIIVKLISNLMF